MLLNSPLVITLRVAWSACKARRKLGRAGTDLDAQSSDATPATGTGSDTEGVSVCAGIEMPESAAPAKTAASVGTARPPPSPEVVRRQSKALQSDETAHLRRAANQARSCVVSDGRQSILYI